MDKIKELESRIKAAIDWVDGLCKQCRVMDGQGLGKPSCDLCQILGIKRWLEGKDGNAGKDGKVRKAGVGNYGDGLR